MADTVINKIVSNRHKRLLGSNLRYMHREVEKIIDDLSAQYGYSRNEIRKIVVSPYSMLKDIRQTNQLKCDPSDGFPAIRIPYLGIFSARESYIDRFVKSREETDGGTVRTEQQESGSTKS